MKKSFWTTVILALLLFAPTAYSQDRGPRPSKAPDVAPGGPMGGMMSHDSMGMMHGEGTPFNRRGGVAMMRRNPHLAGIMMQMRGEMMRIRGEAMMKEGDVLRRYGERLEKETPLQPPPGARGR